MVIINSNKYQTPNELKSSFKHQFRDFTGGPVVRILCSHCRRHGFDL